MVCEVVVLKWRRGGVAIRVTLRISKLAQHTMPHTRTHGYHSTDSLFPLPAFSTLNARCRVLLREVSSRREVTRSLLLRAADRLEDAEEEAHAVRVQRLRCDVRPRLPGLRGTRRTRRHLEGRSLRQLSL